MAMDMFIKIGSLKGESVDKTHAGEIDVLAWSWGMSNSGSAHVGGGAGAGKVNVQDLSFTKYIDSASNGLMTALAKGSHIDKCSLLVRKAGEGQQRYIQIDMEEVLVSSVSTGGSGGEDRLTENVTLNFSKVTFNYATQDSKGGVGADATFGWDIAQNVAT